MQILEQIWATITIVFHWLTFSPVNTPGTQQQHPFPSFPDTGHSTVSGGVSSLAKGPVFKPPSAGPTTDFTCDYSKMVGWQACSTVSNRACWLRNPTTGKQYDINSDYESNGPTGILRSYTLILNDGNVNADGIVFEEAKLFNNTYPGPWIQACWGDRLNITVINNMKHNGTSIHWHGIRQLLNNQMDGVNGVTQCPIAPGDYFSYVFNATQYGSTWYHSHYSTQYADGLQGPITFHGPSSAPFDEPKLPLIMTDWGHNSAFQAEYIGLRAPSILVNGKGNVTRYLGTRPNSVVPNPYQLYFQPKASTGLGRAKKYLLRLINTSFDSTFVFSIDNHVIQVVTADFVAIQPYFTNSVLVGIGQRYNVIVEAAPSTAGSANPVPADGNFWIRTWLADGCPVPGCPPPVPGSPACSLIPIANYERAAILRYDPSSTTNPTSLPWPNVQKQCADEPYALLKPIVPWSVGSPANGGSPSGEELNITVGPGRPGYILAGFSFEPSRQFAFNPMQVDYDNPTIFHFGDSSPAWPESWVIVPENYVSTEWVYLVITGSVPPSRIPPFPITFGPHPLHLHGHDFAILQQVANTPFTPGALNLKINNPPRRDVVLLPVNGFVVLAFKTDNPGSWLLHCHIASHASSGLALQILERQGDAKKMFPPSSPAIKEAQRGCRNWNTWYSNCGNWWRGCDPRYAFNDDSGI